MKVIRTEIFETNSSSSHSISIKGGTYVQDILQTDDDKTCNIYPGEFGWGPETYTYASTKASYCLTYIKNCAPKEKKNEYSRMLKDVILETIACKDVKFTQFKKDEWYPWGYIDHQSNNVCEQAFSTKQILKDFIFNPKSILEIDHDNH